MRSRIFLFLAAAAFLAALWPSPAQADALADFQRQQVAQQKGYNRYLNEVPDLDHKHPSRAMSEVFSLSWFNGQLVLRTNLATTKAGQPRKVKIDSDTDWSIINVFDGAVGNGPVIPLNFTFSQSRYDPRHTITLSVQSQRGSFLMINQQDHSVTGRKITQLQMQFPNAMTKVGLFQLLVMDQTPGRASPPTIWHSANFSDFMREHPIVADTYLRPLFHQLAQDPAMAPDPMMTFEIFSDQWKPAAESVAKINTLVADLTGGTFRTRTQAERNLSDLGQDAALVLMRLDRTKLTDEQNARIDKVLSPYLPVSAKEAKALRSNPSFLLNCLYSNDLLIRKVAMTNLERVSKLKLNFDPAADAPTRNAAIATILATLVKHGLVSSN